MGTATPISIVIAESDAALVSFVIHNSTNFVSLGQNGQNGWDTIASTRDRMVLLRVYLFV